MNKKIKNILYVSVILSIISVNKTYANENEFKYIEDVKADTEIYTTSDNTTNDNTTNGSSTRIYFEYNDKDKDGEFVQIKKPYKLTKANDETVYKKEILDVKGKENINNYLYKEGLRVYFYEQEYNNIEKITKTTLTFIDNGDKDIEAKLIFYDYNSENEMKDKIITSEITINANYGKKDKELEIISAIENVGISNSVNVIRNIDLNDKAKLEEFIKNNSLDISYESKYYDEKNEVMKYEIFMEKPQQRIPSAPNSETDSSGTSASEPYASYVSIKILLDNFSEKITPDKSKVEFFTGELYIDDKEKDNEFKTDVNKESFIMYKYSNATVKEIINIKNTAELKELIKKLELNESSTEGIESKSEEKNEYKVGFEKRKSDKQEGFLTINVLDYTNKREENNSQESDQESKQPETDKETDDKEDVENEEVKEDVKEISKEELEETLKKAILENSKVEINEIDSESTKIIIIDADGKNKEIIQVNVSKKSVDEIYQKLIKENENKVDENKENGNNTDENKTDGNSNGSSIKDKTNPQTGDNQIVIYIIGVISCIGVIGAIIYIIKIKNKK